MKVKIYNSDFDLEKYDTKEFVELLYQSEIVAFNVTASQFKSINSILMPISKEYEYVQEFLSVSNGDCLYYYRPVDYDRNKVKSFLNKELNK